MYKLLLLLFISASFFVSVSLTVAAPESGGHGTEAVTLEPPISHATSPNIIIGKGIEMILSVVGSLALLMFVYGGLTWMLAAGNNERVQKGKEILMWAVIGMVVIFSAYAMVKLIFEGIGVK